MDGVGRCGVNGRDEEGGWGIQFSYLRLVRRLVLQQQGRLGISSLGVHGGGASELLPLLSPPAQEGEVASCYSSSGWVWVQARSREAGKGRPGACSEPQLMLSPSVSMTPTTLV